MSHFLGEAVVPSFFINGEGPTLGGAGFLDGVAVAALAVSMNGVAAKQVGVSHAFAAIDFGPIIHAARLGPALLGDGGHVAVHLKNEIADIFTFGFVAVDVSAHV